jgi:hypothetical protein
MAALFAELIKVRVGLWFLNIQNQAHRPIEPEFRRLLLWRSKQTERKFSIPVPFKSLSNIEQQKCYPCVEPKYYAVLTAPAERQTPNVRRREAKRDALRTWLQMPNVPLLPAKKIDESILLPILRCRFSRTANVR